MRDCVCSACESGPTGVLRQGQAFLRGRGDGLVDTRRGVRTQHTTYVATHPAHYSFVGTHTWLGTMPSEAAWGRGGGNLWGS